jgi:hypothetical protein
VIVGENESGSSYRRNLPIEGTCPLETLAEENGAASPRARSRRLPLRDAYLPSVMHALDMERRICAGGPVALLTVALSLPACAAGFHVAQ